MTRAEITVTILALIGAAYMVGDGFGYQRRDQEIRTTQKPAETKPKSVIPIIGCDKNGTICQVHKQKTKNM